MRALRRVPVPGAGERGPEVWLLDAREEGLDDEVMRDRARALAAAAGAPHAARSYRHPFALVAWHSEPVGVDIERVTVCDHAFAELVCTPDELAESARVDERDAYLTSLWSSKEALSKALGDAVRYDPNRLPSPAGWPDSAAGPWRAAPIDAAPAHAAWVCWRERGT